MKKGFWGILVLMGFLFCLPGMLQANFSELINKRYTEERAANGDTQKLLAIYLKYDILMAEQSVREEDPNFAHSTKKYADDGSLMSQELRYANDLKDYYGVDSSEYKAAITAIEATQKQIVAMASALEEKALAGTQAPKDIYKGKDKEKFKAMIKAAWTKEYPQDKLLGIRFSAENWKRQQTKDWIAADSAYKYYDMSVLVVSVIVNLDGKIARIYPAYVNKDNLNDGVITLGVGTKGSTFVQTDMLVSNFR